VKNYLNFFLNTLAAFALLITSNVSVAKSVDLNKLRSEDTLFTCLRMNYQKISPDAFKNDYSYFHPRYLPLSSRSRADYDLKFGEFLEKQVGDFYKEEISVKAENSRGPHTVIFAKCIEFSESKALRDFFQKNPLPAKPYNNR
jgi:site-specific DNA-adenine methylase